VGSRNSILTFQNNLSVPFSKAKKSNKNSLDRFKKNNQILNFIKIRPLVAELFRTERQTGTKKLIVAFRNFVNAPNTYETSINSLNLLFISQPVLV
jgi:hypothetical protein